MNLELPAAILLLLPALGAQSQSFTSPAGMAITEGNGAFFTFAGDRRLQVLDATDPSPKNAIRSLALRRDGGEPASLNFGSRTMTIALWMGHGSFANRGPQFARNYLATPTNVVAPRIVRLPDWIQRPTNVPAPFDFVVAPFDIPFSYRGTDALVYEIVHTHSDGVGLVAADRQFHDTVTGSRCQSLYRGCQTPQHADPFTHDMTLFHDASARTLTLWPTATRGPRQVPFLLALDVTNPDVQLPGLCARILSGGQALMGVGSSDLEGARVIPKLVVPNNPALILRTIYSQIIALMDSTTPSPLFFSNGCATLVPPQINAAYLYAAPTATTGSLFSGGCPVTVFRY